MSELDSGKIVAAAKRYTKTIVHDGRTYRLRKRRLSNVDYVVVTPIDGPVVPMANVVMDESEYRREMNRRGREADLRR